MPAAKKYHKMGAGVSAAVKKKVVFIVVLAVLIVGGSFYGYWQKNTVTESAASTSVRTSQLVSPEVVVYVSGAVNRPGVVKVSENARVVDVINAAGGLLPGADTSKINLAQPVKDGMHIDVPAKPAASGQAEVASVAASAKNAKININTASQQELDKLSGIGPALAERIVKYREEKGAFKEITELKNVPGIGESKFNRLKDQVTL